METSEILDENDPKFLERQWAFEEGRKYARREMYFKILLLTVFFSLAIFSYLMDIFSPSSH